MDNWWVFYAANAYNSLSASVQNCRTADGSDCQTPKKVMLGDPNLPPDYEHGVWSIGPSYEPVNG
ncbi:hypothetical protein [Kitasatospora purpeofusca]|uniref:hypothetical protein n=1 Tax=Kitasatospora purpeofusca TaxID=67352 RepID=UPI0036BD1458